MNIYLAQCIFGLHLTSVEIFFDFSTFFLQLSWNSKLKLPIHKKEHRWKKFLSRTLFCQNFAHLQFSSFSEVEDQLLKMYMFQMTWNSKLKLPRYIKGHPWKKIGGQTPFLHTNLHICNFQCCQIRSSITQNLYVSNDLKFKT